MDFDLIKDTIINEPIYLTILLLLISVIVYSVLKKFFKLLLIILVSLLLYIFYLIFTGSDLPGDSELIINPIIDNAGDMLEKIGDEYNKYKNDNTDK